MSTELEEKLAKLDAECDEASRMRVYREACKHLAGVLRAAGGHGWDRIVGIADTEYLDAHRAFRESLREHDEVADIL